MPDEETIERWRRKGFDLRYGPHWYLHYDGRPPIDDDRDYVWSALGRVWQAVDDPEDVDEDDLEEYEERKRQRIARENEF